MKILLNGYFHKNFGDDLFFHIICKRYNNHIFYAPIEKECAHAYMGENNIKVLSINKLIRGIDKLTTKLNPKFSYYNILNHFTDLSVLIGGSMFQELYGDRHDLERIDNLPDTSKALYILGVNFGPYKTIKYLNKCKKYLAGATDVCFRDNESYSLFKDLNNTRVATDIVFGIEKIAPKAKEKKNVCVISVMDFSTRSKLKKYRESYEKFILSIIEKQLEIGREVILMSFCKYEGDENAIKRIMEICHQKQLTKINVHYYYGYNWMETLNIISSSSYIIASRFHSMILGIVYGIPTLPIIYNEKFRKILNDLDLKNFGVELDELNEFEKKQFKSIPAQDITVLKQKAELQFLELDKILIDKN